MYSAEKVWRQLARDGVIVARCTVERLMRELGLRGAVRGRAFKVTTVADESAHRPSDLVQREFSATRPNQLWVADITYVATWTGFVYVAFVIDVFSRRIVGDSYDNALAETINSLFKTEGIWKQGPWRAAEDVEFATLEGVDWLNNRRLLGPLGFVPPAEFEANYYRCQDVQGRAA